MTREDSPIKDFYPTKLKFDPNGKKFSWQWVVLLPFIDEARLVAAMTSIWVRGREQYHGDFSLTFVPLCPSA
jgi:5'-3' exonuclease